MLLEREQNLKGYQCNVYSVVLLYGQKCFSFASPHPSDAAFLQRKWAVLK